MKSCGAISVGTLSTGRRAWRVECRPHVMLRLKRTFEGTSKTSHGFALVGCSARNARDLLWFLERYPMDVPAAVVAEMEGLARQDEERERTIEAITTGGYVAPTIDLALPLREYQAIAASLCIGTGGLLCADDLGLGKTAVGIAAIAAEGGLPALVVTQTHLQSQWVDQLAKFAPRLSAHVLRTRSNYDLCFDKRRGRVPFPDVVVTSYAKISAWADALAEKMRTVVFDEAQEIRRPENSNGEVVAKYAAAKHLGDHAVRRLGLTATPVYNYGSEVHAVSDVLSPGALGSLDEFKREWCVGDSVRDPKAFAGYLRDAGLMIRRTRKDVARELPGGQPQRVPHLIDADLEAIDQVATGAAELARVILSQGRGFDKMRAGGELDWKLRQATGIAKAPHVAAFVDLLLESEPKVVLFGWHHEVYQLWAERLRRHDPVFYTGRETTKQKDAAKAEFLHGKSRVLIMSLRSGAGLDGIQEAARTLVFGELDWSPAVHRQCEGRLFRDGQTDPVVAYYLTAETGSDPIVMDVLGVKRQQIDGIMNPGDEDGDEVQAQVDPEHIAKLARSFLEQRRMTVPMYRREKETAA